MGGHRKRNHPTTVDRKPDNKRTLRSKGNGNNRGSMGSGKPDNRENLEAKIYRIQKMEHPAGTGKKEKDERKVKRKKEAGGEKEKLRKKGWKRKRKREGKEHKLDREKKEIVQNWLTQNRE